MIPVEVFQVWSELLETDGAPQLHGTRGVWNRYADLEREGAIQLQDRMIEHFYRKKIRAHVYIRSKIILLDEQTLSVKC